MSHLTDEERKQCAKHLMKESVISWNKKPRIKTANQLLDNTSHMNWLTPSQKILVEVMMETYSELTQEVNENVIYELSTVIDSKDFKIKNLIESSVLKN